MRRYEPEEFLGVVLRRLKLLGVGGAIHRGPSVRVNPNVQVEFKWRTDLELFGKVEVFDNSSGSGTPELTKRSEDAAGNPQWAEGG